MTKNEIQTAPLYRLFAQNNKTCVALLNLHVCSQRRYLAGNKTLSVKLCLIELAIEGDTKVARKKSQLFIVFRRVRSIFFFLLVSCFSFVLDFVFIDS